MSPKIKVSEGGADGKCVKASVGSEDHISYGCSRRDADVGHIRLTKGCHISLAVRQVSGVQFAAVFQSPLDGSRFHVALSANERSAINHENRQRTGKSLF